MSAYAAAYAPPQSYGKGWAPPRTSATPVSAFPSPELVASVPVRRYAFTTTASVQVGSRAVMEYRGTVPRPFVGGDAEFSVLKALVTESEVAEIVAIGTKVLGGLIGVGRAREPEIDTRPSFCVNIVERGSLCGELGDVLRPLVDAVIAPFIRQRYGKPEAMLSAAHFRRFVPEERRFLPPHHEYSAFATVRISLQPSDAFTGGLFVQGSGRAFLDRKFLEMERGDACVHQSDLYHGVDVLDGSRYELVLFFRDAPGTRASWFMRAAMDGDPAAQYGFALSYPEGARDGQQWLEKACAQDFPEALHALAGHTWKIEDTARSLQLLRRAAELGYASSQSRLGGLLVQGVKGRVQQDMWEGKRLLRMGFEQDDPDAAFHLGHVLLQEGDRDGVTKLMAAGAKGHPRACFQLAEMYREGQHVPKDLSKSLIYTKWAAHQGDGQAQSNLGHLLINGSGVLRDEAKAVRLFRQSAKIGTAEGELNYGLALLRGNGGLRVDYQEALEWAQKSAAQGHSLAQQQLPMFYNALKNPNPPARSVPTPAELSRLSVRDLRDLLRSEGVDFSDCVEKSDLMRRAAMHLPGVDEPWDAAPEHTLLIEPPKRSRAELVKQREQQQQTVQQQQQQPLQSSSAAVSNWTTGATSYTSAADTEGARSSAAKPLSGTAHPVQKETAPPAAVEEFEPVD